jgi:hypothetical protein
MEVDQVTELKVQIAVLQTQLNSVIVSLTEVKNDLRSALAKVSEDTVTKEELKAQLDPLRLIVYGLVTAFIGAIVKTGFDFFTKH